MWQFIHGEIREEKACRRASSTNNTNTERMKGENIKLCKIKLETKLFNSLKLFLALNTFVPVIKHEHIS